jgi:hypothetical protein
MEHSEHVVEYPVQQEQHAAQQMQMQHATLLATSVSIALPFQCQRC